MPFSFPASAVGATSTQNGRQYVYAGNNTWELVAASGGGSGDIVEAATAAAFPATGAAQTLYHARDVRRIYFWDSAAGVYAEAGPSGGGGSGGDGTDTVLRDLFKPAAPTSVTAAAGNAQVALSWTAPTGVIAQAPITDYTVQVSSNSGTTWTTFADGTSTATSATVTGLTNGTAYVFRVAAVNAVGAGAYSTASNSVTPSEGVFVPIPAMTSNTAPSGAVSGERNDDNTVLWQCFDNNAATEVILFGSGSSVNNQRLEYAFSAGTQSLISGYAITLGWPGYGAAPSTLSVSGSNDLTNWTVIHSVSSGWTAGQERSFTLAQPAKYRAYRWVFNEGLGGPALSVASIRLVQ